MLQTFLEMPAILHHPITIDPIIGDAVKKLSRRARTADKDQNEEN